MLKSRAQHATDRVRRRLAGFLPSRRRAERLVSAAPELWELPEARAIIPRYFMGSTPNLHGADIHGPVDVSVIIPVYNTERWLDDCLESVLAQTGVSLEVLCVNDGSTDASRAVIERHAAADTRIKIIDQPNSGQSVGRNAGMDAARGRFIIYIDSDDFWVANSLAALVRRADEDELDMLFFESVSFRDGSVDADVWHRYAKYYPRSRGYRRLRTGAQMLADMRSHEDYRAHVGMYIARTEHVRGSGARFIPGIVHQDNPYTFALTLNARRAAHTRNYFYARRLRPGSTITALRAMASAKGYFLSALAMTREVRRLVLDVRATRAAADVIGGVLRSARKQFSQLSDTDRGVIVALDVSVEGRVLADWLTDEDGGDLPLP